VSVQGPSKAEVRCAENVADNSFAVTYYPLIAGSYEISVLLASKHIPGSPFTASIVSPGTTVHVV